MIVDEAATGIIRAWRRLGRELPKSISDLIAFGRVTEAALDSVEQILGRDRILGWRMTYSSRGGPYGAYIFMRCGVGGNIVEYSSISRRSLPEALIIALEHALREEQV